MERTFTELCDYLAVQGLIEMAPREVCDAHPEWNGEIPYRLTAEGAQALFGLLGILTAMETGILQLVLQKMDMPEDVEVESLPVGVMNKTLELMVIHPWWGAACQQILDTQPGEGEE